MNTPVIPWLKRAITRRAIRSHGLDLTFQQFLATRAHMISVEDIRRLPLANEPAAVTGFTVGFDAIGEGEPLA